MFLRKNEKENLVRKGKCVTNDARNYLKTVTVMIREKTAVTKWKHKQWVETIIGLDIKCLMWKKKSSKIVVYPMSEIEWEQSEIQTIGKIR